jgi:hypothetical protein
VALFAAVMHLGALAGFLPEPRPMLDVDRTILIHQIEASRRSQNAEIVLVGDSSCLMDVSTRQLGELLGRPVLNLGTLSYLDLRASADLLREFSAANPRRLRAVVVLQHPEALRRIGPESYHTNLLRHLLARADFLPRTSLRDHITGAFGLHIFRGRILSRIVPTALPGSFGRRYGFSDDLDDYLSHHRGSAVDPDTQPLRGSTEYRLAPSMEFASRSFREAVPAGVKLLVGMTPVPEALAGARYPETRDRLLSQWGQWLGADVFLKELPPTLPDENFAKSTHLNELGVRSYTEMVARALAPHLP